MFNWGRVLHSLLRNPLKAGSSSTFSAAYIGSTNSRSASSSQQTLPAGPGIISSAHARPNCRRRHLPPCSSIRSSVQVACPGAPAPTSLNSSLLSSSAMAPYTLSLYASVNSRSPHVTVAALIRCLAVTGGEGRDKDLAAASRQVLCELLADPLVASEPLFAAMCACAAVVAPSTHWPPWIARYFLGGDAAQQQQQQLHGITTTRQRGRRSKSKVADAASAPDTAQEAMGSIARSVLSHLAKALSESSQHSGFALLDNQQRQQQEQRLTLALCGLCVASSRESAAQLACSALQYGSHDAAPAVGGALAAFCSAYCQRQQQRLRQRQGASVLPTVNTEQTRSEHTGAAPVPVALTDALFIEDASLMTAEHLWLVMWQDISFRCGVPIILPPSMSVSDRPSTLMAEKDSCGVWSQATYRHFIRWQAHCLLTENDLGSLFSILDELSRSGIEFLATTLSEGIIAQLLTTLPDTFLKHQSPKCCDVLARVLLESLRATCGGDHGFSPSMSLSASSFSLLSAVPPRASRFVPTVTSNAVLYARMLDYITRVARAATARPQLDESVRDLSLLLSVANIDALAASMVPEGRPLTEVMVAERDASRAEKTAALAAALNGVIDLILPAQMDGFRSEGSTGRYSEGAMRIGAEHADDTVRLGASVLSRLLLLCASREGCFPERVAEPAWRRELRARTAVRSHKYQLLLSEIPHAQVCHLLHTLLGRGYVEEGAEVGSALVAGGLVDIRYYALPVLGCLYQAICTCALQTAEVSCVAGGIAAPSHKKGTDGAEDCATNGMETTGLSETPRGSVLARLGALCRTRLEVFGDSVPLADSAPTAAVRIDHDITSSQVLVDGGGGSTHVLPRSSSPLSAALVPTSHEDSTAPALTGLGAMASLMMYHAQHGLVLTEPAAHFVYCLQNRATLTAGGGLAIDFRRQRAFASWEVKGTVHVG